MNLFKKTISNATESKKIYGEERTESKSLTIKCESCGAARPSNTNLAKCDYCGYIFMKICVKINN